jgi:hypothetical protein
VLLLDQSADHHGPADATVIEVSISRTGIRGIDRVAGGVLDRIREFLVDIQRNEIGAGDLRRQGEDDAGVLIYQ